MFSLFLMNVKMETKNQCCSRAQARLGLARFWLELLVKKLGSARPSFQKARFVKICQNEPLFKKIFFDICLPLPSVVRFSKFKSLLKANRNSHQLKIWAHCCICSSLRSVALEKYCLEFKSVLIILHFCHQVFNLSISFIIKHIN